MKALVSKESEVTHWCKSETNRADIKKPNFRSKKDTLQLDDDDELYSCVHVFS